ncbi:PREDICTED: uncharacterized protein LOC109185404 [Ipomoea nil]|uniref:uncharacterized protein LOC109185404 n=1 Tax=Ipomoea nil TaxID=35883 RepID=UPI000900CEC3|nr:PREDICTED: uncharacterized protein LOC109185404 [Ipomoea nil]
MSKPIETLPVDSSPLDGSSHPSHSSVTNHPNLPQVLDSSPLPITSHKLNGHNYLPADWKPKPHTDQSRANVAATSETSPNEVSPFSKIQLEALQKLFGQISVAQQSIPPSAEAHVSMMSHQGCGLGEGDWQC